MQRVLVFDSGVGGLSVVRAIEAAGLPVRLDYLADGAWLPYGGRADAALAVRVPRLAAGHAAALDAACVILACNTASTLALDATRAASPCPVIGVVPPIKPAAAQSRTGVIGLLATVATARRAYTDKLIADHAQGVRVLRHGAAGLVGLAEAHLRGTPAPVMAVRQELAGLLAQEGGSDIDVVALACTHFPLLADALAAAAPGVAFIDSGAAIARRLAQVLGLSEAAPTGAGGPVLGCAWATGPAYWEQTAAVFQRWGFAQTRLASDPDA